MLVRVLADAPSIPLRTWLIMHEDLAASLTVRRLFDYLAEGIRTYLATSR